MPAAVAEAMRRCSLVVVSSGKGRETFCSVASEALACGTPLVVTRCGGPEDFVGPEDGVMIEADDPAAMTAGILTALDRRDEFREAEISARVVARFGRTAWRTQAMAIYEFARGSAWLKPIRSIAEATQTSLPVRQPALDGVRAVAVMLVLAAHANLFKLGGLGVDIFFGLSGYLITGILLDAKAAHPSKRDYFVPFYMRRALRILPLAWAVALIAATIEGQWSGLLWYMGYLVNWLPSDPPPDVLGHYWSLAVEEQFYLVWPAVVLFAPRRELPAITVGVILFDIICRLIVSISPPRFRELLSSSISRPSPARTPWRSARSLHSWSGRGDSLSGASVGRGSQRSLRRP